MTTLDAQAYKRCRKCGETKPVEEFYRDSGQKDGHDQRCKKCYSVKQHAFYLSHIEEKKAQDREYREANAQRLKQRRADLYAANVERERAKLRQYRLANRDSVHRWNQKQYWSRVEEMRRRTREYTAANRERIWARNREYYRTHREQRFDEVARRRARLLQAQVESVCRAKVYERDRGRCHICGKKVNPKRWHMDHLTPLSLGGAHSYKNVAVACPNCNMARGNRGPAQLRLLD